MTDLPIPEITEIWKPIPNMEQYHASNFGRLKNSITGIILKATKSKTGYMVVTIGSERCSRRQRKVHRIIKETFHGPSDLLIDHINGIKDDNRLENLDYVTPKENRIRWAKNHDSMWLTYQKRDDSWRVAMTSSLDGKRKIFGYFKNYYDAARVRDIILEIRPDYGRDNTSPDKGSS